jgi:anti-sigma-K factor RskA
LETPAGPLAIANDETKTVLDDASAAAVLLMLDKVADHDVAEVYDVTSGQGPITNLAAEAMRARDIDLWRLVMRA